MTLRCACGFTADDHNKMAVHVFDENCRDLGQDPDEMRRLILKLSPVKPPVRHWQRPSQYDGAPE